MAEDHIKNEFTLEAKQTLLAGRGDPEPTKLNDVAAIWEFQPENSRTPVVKIMTSDGGEKELTEFKNLDELLPILAEQRHPLLDAVDDLTGNAFLIELSLIHI